uniref:Chymotrypsin-like elastase family member 1 n=1 Tax=Lygus hesperus TaxID=30085 RepID=A0A0A9XVN4_LYGHE
MKLGAHLILWSRTERSGVTMDFLIVLFGIHLVQIGSAQLQVKPAKPSDFPYFTTVLYHGRGICGATLFTSSHAFTACHCLVKDPTSPFKAPHVLIDVGRIELDAGNESSHPTGQSRFAQMIRVHPKCESGQRSMAYDYGVIKVEKPFDLREGYTEVFNILGQGNAVQEVINENHHKDCYSLDFKTLEKDGKPWTVGGLEMSKLGILHGDICRDLFKYNNKDVDFFPDVQVCTVNKEVVDATFFCGLPDYGGPLVCFKSGSLKEERVFVGVLSGRNHHYCKPRSIPSKKVQEVYARVDAAVMWILNEYPDLSTTTIATTTKETTTEMASTTVNHLRLRVLVQVPVLVLVLVPPLPLLLVQLLVLLLILTMILQCLQQFRTAVGGTTANHRPITFIHSSTPRFPS